LLAAAGFLFTAGLMRALVLLGWLSREHAVIVNSVAALSFVVVGLQLAFMRKVDAHVQQVQDDRKE
jgi:hypothetical protein